MTDRPYLPLLRAFEAAHVRYAIAGGLAVVLHGVARMTFDLDLVVDLADDNMQALVNVLTAEGYQPRLPVALAQLADKEKREEWTSTRNLIAFSLMHPQRAMEEVDILIARVPAWPVIAATLAKRPINGDEVAVVGRSLLREMKLGSGRDKDLADAALLAEHDD